MTAMTNTNRVYGGTWNPVSGAYPLHNGDGCVWDVVLNDGVENFKFDGIVWGSGHRVGYDAATKSYHQITSNVGVHSVNGKNGAVVMSYKDVGARPDTWMPTPADVKAVPLSRTVNGKELSKDISLTVGDVGGVAPTRKVNGKALSADITLNAADVNAVPTTRKVNGKVLSTDVTLSASDVGALASGGTAVAATKLATARKISGVEFDGTKDVAISAADVGALAVEDHTELPFPDVWIPFNDNLRMLAGYGEDIKVGDETVATKASFSRASTATYIDKAGVLRTAAVNEPRFEKEGLLIEGQSTNLLKKSEYDGTNSTFYTPSNPLNILESVDTPFGKGAALTVDALGDGSRYMWRSGVSDGAEIGKSYTFSFWVYINHPGVEKVAIGSNNTEDPTKTLHEVEPFKWYRLTHSGVLKNNSTTAFIWPYGSGVGGSVDGLAIGDKVITVTAAQVEALPFATSYIPTNGAAATRAADVCLLGWANNIPAIEGGVPFTTSAEFHVWNNTGFTHRCALNQSAEAGNFITRLNRDSNSMVFYRGPTSSATFVPEINKPIVLSMTSNEENFSSLYKDGTFVSGKSILPTTPGMPSLLGIGCSPSGKNYQLYGHIRNLRIWHRALSDAQLKSIR